jgi:hypothetical protein
MIVIIEEPKYDIKSTCIRLESENNAESLVLILLGRRIKKPVQTWGMIKKDKVVLLLTIPIRIQKQSDDEFGNRVP